MFLHFLCWKTTTSKCCKNTVNTDVFWRAMCRKHCKYRGFWCNVQKTSYVSRFCAFWLKSIGIYGVFSSPSAENCVNSMVFERFWTSGKQKLLVFTGFCERNSWKTLVFAGFSRVFSCDFINFLHRLTGLDVDKTLPLRARARDAWYASLFLILSPWRHRRCAKPVNSFCCWLCCRYLEKQRSREAKTRKSKKGKKANSKSMKLLSCTFPSKTTQKENNNKQKRNETQDSINAV